MEVAVVVAKVVAIVIEAGPFVALQVAEVVAMVVEAFSRPIGSSNSRSNSSSSSTIVITIEVVKAGSNSSRHSCKES